MQVSQYLTQRNLVIVSGIIILLVLYFGYYVEKLSQEDTDSKVNNGILDYIFGGLPFLRPEFADHAPKLPVDQPGQESHV